MTPNSNTGCEGADLFKDQTALGQSSGELLFSLDLPGRLPSWNEILGMQHFSRQSLKSRLLKEFGFALRASAAACSTRTICAPSTLLTAAATLASFEMMRRERRKLRSAKKRLEANQKSLSALKSSGGK
jgi:hypothetical protein